MSTALPMWAVLYPKRDEDKLLHVKEIACRIAQAIPGAVIDWARGHEYWERRHQELIAARTPEVILESHGYSKGHVVYLSVSYPDWPDRVAFSYAQSVNPELGDAVFLQVTEPFDLGLLKRATADIPAALDYRFHLEAYRHSYFRTRTEPGSFTDPAAFLRHDMAYYEWNKVQFNLRPLHDWERTVQSGVLHWLAACAYKPEVDASAARFDSREAFAAAVVKELNAVGPVQRAWAVDIAKVAHQNGILLDHGDWMTIVHFDGVPKGILI